MSEIPIIDVAPLFNKAGNRASVAAAIGRACCDYGFFYVVGHGVSPSLIADLEQASRSFFDQPLPAKQEIAMSRGGRAWRGYFPVGGELTSGKPDQKEGIYFGTELGTDHPRVKAGTPMHGPNLFPAHPAELRPLVLDYMDALTRLGHGLMAGISLSLGLEETYFASRYTANPLLLFRIFNYPHGRPDDLFGVGEHTDYGLLTILKQDMSGGLEIKMGSRWIDAPPVPDSFVCNLGDMLDRMTGGRYLSTPHRVQNPATHNRISFAFFFDPDFDAIVEPIEGGVVHENKSERWDRASVHEFQGTYGDYLLGKVSKVFPQLRREVL